MLRSPTMSFSVRLAIVSAVLLMLVATCSRAATSSIDLAYSLLNQRVISNRTNFYLYHDQDDGLNHGFPSGFYGNIAKIHLNSGCIDDPNAANGCSADPNRLDREHGNVLMVSFDALTAGDFVGVNIEEPENYGAQPRGVGYDIRGATQVVFDIRTPTFGGINVQFGVAGHMSSYVHVAQSATYTTMSLTFASLGISPTELANVHLLFAVATNVDNAPAGGTVLLDNIHFAPVPIQRQAALGFPLGSQTFGVLPLQNMVSGRVTLPPDQVQRNLTTIYESAMTLWTLLHRGTPNDLANARVIADTFDYALHHENHGDPLPAAPDGSVGLHNGYSSGDIAFNNDQQPPKGGKQGDARLAGFSAGTTLCGSSGYCLVLDGATGGNNAFAILSLVAAYKQFHDARYLTDAMTIGHWIVGNLMDQTGTGFGGYYLGYPDQGQQKTLITSKSIENNADIFAAFSALANLQNALGNPTDAGLWTQRANVAGDFIMRMYDATLGRFYAGTLPVGTLAGPGLQPTGVQRGNDIINTFNFLDSNTFVVLALASTPRYRNQIDWRGPIQFAAGEFSQSIQAGGQTFKGFNIVSIPTAGPNGVAWEFTGQAVAAMRFVDRLYNDTRFEGSAATYLNQIQMAQLSAPFTDDFGLVASTVQNGDTLVPIDQCLSTPFQNIAERVGLAATVWSILAAENANLFLPFYRPVDFAQNGDADLVFQNNADSQIAFWYLNETTIVGGDQIASVPSSGYQVVGVGDFNGDGHPDLVFQNQSSGQIAVWYLDRNLLLGGAAVGNMPAPGYKVVGVGDFNGDGYPDLLFQNQSTGQLVVWYMAGASYLGGGAITDVPAPGYQVVGVGDVNGDGYLDIVFQNAATGQIVVWYLNGIVHIGGAAVSQVPDPNWLIRAVDDYNRDGTPDFVFQNRLTGAVAIWYMNGVNFMSGGLTSLVPDTGYMIVGPH